MEQVMKHDLYKSFLDLEKDVHKQWPITGSMLHVKNISKREFVEQAFSVCDILGKFPYLAAHAVSHRTGMTRDQLAVVYKIIQRSTVCQDFFIRSKNRDYFNVVNHYFNNRLYTLVFFVGTSCPCRCTFCPNVKLDSLGRRRLVTYGQKHPKALSFDHLDRIFSDLSTLRDEGYQLLVKISGGLEPLTDIESLCRISGFASDMHIPVKLFTNGVLLKDPEKRKAALTTGDIRISLNTPDEDQYQRTCFSGAHQKKSRGRSALSTLIKSIRLLVSDRNALNKDCRIGFNCVILPENHTQLVSLLELARNLKLDYIDFKPDYFSVHPQETIDAMDASIKEAKVVAAHESYRDLYVNFTGALSRQDLYWNTWSGNCDTLKQSDFKMFINPFGHCCPVHYGAFPHSESSFNQSLGAYTIGEIDDHHGLLDVMNHPVRTPAIALSRLNPYELMLSLEITREEEDKAWGLPICVSPYHTREKDRIPADLFFRFSIKK